MRELEAKPKQVPMRTFLRRVLGFAQTVDMPRWSSRVGWHMVIPGQDLEVPRVEESGLASLEALQTLPAEQDDNRIALKASLVLLII